LAFLYAPVCFKAPLDLRKKFCVSAGIINLPFALYLTWQSQNPKSVIGHRLLAAGAKKYPVKNEQNLTRQ